MFGQVYAVRALLDHGADVAAVDQVGRGVLHHAVSSSGSDEIVQILLAAEAPLELKDAQGQTATARAAQLSGGSMSTGGKMLTGAQSKQAPVLLAWHSYARLAVAQAARNSHRSSEDLLQKGLSENCNVLSWL